MRIGVIGLGQRLGHLVAEFAAVAPEARFVAVADPSDVRLAQLEQKGITFETRHEDGAALIAAHEFDLLMIGSPNMMHLEHLRAALQSNAPAIFTEKPVVISMEETLELARLIGTHDGVKRLMPGMVLRYSPLYRALRAAQAEHLGPISSIEASEHIAPYHGSFFMRDWRRETKLSGGFLLEKCCHDIDLYQGVVGSRPARVVSFGGRKKYLPENRPAGEPAYLSEMAPRWGGTNDAFSGTADIIDYQTALIEYQGGESMAFHTNLNVPDEFRRFCVIGRDGMAEGDFLRNYFKVTLSDDGKAVIDEKEVATDTSGGHYGADSAMARDITNHLRGDLPQLPLSIIDALEAGVTALAADASRTENRIVELAEYWDAFDHALAGEVAA